MGNCARLKFARKELKLTQQQFADKTGVSVATIARLETDETAWDTVQNATFDKVMRGLEDKGVWLKQQDKPEPKKLTFDDLPKGVTIGPEEAKGIVMMFNQSEQTKKNDKDTKTLEMLEFVMECLRDSETHEEFETNLKNMKRILKKY